MWHTATLINDGKYLPILRITSSTWTFAYICTDANLNSIQLWNDEINLFFLISLPLQIIMALNTLVFAILQIYVSIHTLLEHISFFFSLSIS